MESVNNFLAKSTNETKEIKNIINDIKNLKNNFYIFVCIILVLLLAILILFFSTKRKIEMNFLQKIKIINNRKDWL